MGRGFMTEQAQQEPRLTRAWMVCQCCHKVTLAIAGLTQHQLPIEQMDACPHPCVGARVVGLVGSVRRLVQHT